MAAGEEAIVVSLGAEVKNGGPKTEGLGQHYIFLGTITGSYEPTLLQD